MGKVDLGTGPLGLALKLMGVTGAPAGTDLLLKPGEPNGDTAKERPPPATSCPPSPPHPNPGLRSHHTAEVQWHNLAVTTQARGQDGWVQTHLSSLVLMWQNPLSLLDCCESPVG